MVEILCFVSGALVGAGAYGYFVKSLVIHMGVDKKQL